MEGLSFGWKKSIEKYHYFDEGSLSSACDVANFNYSTHKQHEFLTEAELELDMNICKKCYSMRMESAKKKIKEAKREKGFWDDTKKCPECKTKVIFWNSNSDKAHECTICSKTVIFA